MDKRPKRNRDKYNPYFLSSDKENNTYIVSFNTNTGKIKLEISKELFDAFDELEKEEARIIQWDKRYLEQSEITEITLYKKTKSNQMSLENKVIRKAEKEKLQHEINKLSPMHKRRILLYFKHNLTMEQIAELEGCSKTAIKYSIDNALRELRKKF